MRSSRRRLAIFSRNSATRRRNKRHLLAIDLTCDRCADLDEHPLQITHVGDGLTPRFGRGWGDDDRSGRERGIPGSGNIVRDEANLDADRWLRRVIAAVTP